MIFLRQSHNIKPPRWGSPVDVQYTVKVNAEKVYGVDPDSIVLAMPLFWGLPPLDYSGFNNHGTNYGSIYKGRGLDFDGNNDYVRSGDVDLPDDYTISTWVYPHDVSGSAEQTVIRKENNYTLFLHTDSKWYIGMSTMPSSSFVFKGSINTATVNQWVYLAAVIEAGVVMDLYVDDVKQGAGTSLVGKTNKTNNIDLALGIDSTNFSNKPFNGAIADVRISNTVRTVDQMSLFYDRPWDLYRPVSRPVYSIPVPPSEFIPQITMF